MTLRSFTIFILLFITGFNTGYARLKPVLSLDECTALNRIDSFYEAKQYDSTVKYIKQFQHSSSLLRDHRLLHLKLFYCYKDKNKDSAYAAIQTAIKYGMHCRDLPCNIPTNFLVFDSLRNEQIRKDYEANNNAIHYDKDLIATIDKLILYDQAARCNKNYTDTVVGLNIDSLRRYMLQVDSINLITVKQIIYQHGWPGYTGIGYQADINLWALVQHADEDVTFQKYCLQLIEAQLLLSNTRSANYAYLYDRICINEGLPQLFGTQAKDVTNLRVVLYPLQDEINVNIYRKAFELGTLDRYITALKQLD